VRYLIILILATVSFEVFSSSIHVPKDEEVSFDVIRKNKIIGNLNTKFTKNGDEITLHSVLDISVKVLFFPAYQFYQETKEKWINGNLISIEGFTDFEDDREYIIVGKDHEEYFIASGMDGELKLDKNILPLNYWNIEMLKEDEVFDTQKGIIRQIKVEQKKDEEIEMNKLKIKANKFIFNASKHPKDKGPFPEYTLWYYENELIKMHFKNPKDKKLIKIIRNDWGK
tara:strand:+ start:956 stop:1636 length:681 start_codon:yes stop_codon:yes gene_type:complete